MSGENELIRHLKGITRAIYDIRLNIKPESRKIIKKYGDIPIIEMYVSRRPITSKYRTLLDYANKLSGHEPVPHDKLFHLFFIFVLEDNTKIIMEKNEDININYYDPSQIDETKKINIRYSPTINELFYNTIKKYGERRVFEYDPFSWNCQRFVMDVLESNNIHVTPTERKFILQKVKDIAPKWAQKLGKLSANIYNRLKMAIYGYGEYPKNYCPVCNEHIKNMNSHMLTNKHFGNLLKIRF
jgi:hypothetical protein